MGSLTNDGELVVSALLPLLLLSGQLLLAALVQQKPALLELPVADALDPPQLLLAPKYSLVLSEYDVCCGDRLGRIHQILDGRVLCTHQARPKHNAQVLLPHLVAGLEGCHPLPQELEQEHQHHFVGSGQLLHLLHHELSETRLPFASHELLEGGEWDDGGDEVGKEALDGVWVE